MRVLADQTGIQAPDSDFLKGRVVDDLTLWNEAINGDIIEFFQKLVSLAGITENTLPENETNGHQLIDALIAKIETVVGLGDTWINVTFGSNWENGALIATTNNLRYRKISDKLVMLEGQFKTTAAGVSTAAVCNLPADYRPLQNQLIAGFNDVDTDNQQQRNFQVQPDGDLLLYRQGDLGSDVSFYINAVYSLD